MKREEILLYLSENKLRIYLYKSKKEYNFDIDTSLFFKWGEISNVEECSKCLEEIYPKISFKLPVLKPNLYILYNDITNCDIKFLYKNTFEIFNYNSITFFPISKLISIIREDKNIAIFDKNYYTDFKKEVKTDNSKSLSSNTFIIGQDNSKRIHYAKIDIIWKTFKEHFTNQKSYGIIDVGDDEC